MRAKELCRLDVSQSGRSVGHRKQRSQSNPNALGKQMVRAVGVKGSTSPCKDDERLQSLIFALARLMQEMQFAWSLNSTVLNVG
jgi:hypothetical protein